MKTRHKRLAVAGGVLVALTAVVALVLNAFDENLVFFYTPTQVAQGEAPKARTFRIGGLVEEGSVKRDGTTVHFVVTDSAKTVSVAYTGILPDLFKEGKGVVAQGQFDGQQFKAREVLAKHDENYMPPEAAEALERAKKAAPAQGGAATNGPSAGAAAYGPSAGATYGPQTAVQGSPQ